MSLYLSAGHANTEVKMPVPVDAFMDSEFPVMPESNTNRCNRKKADGIILSTVPLLL